MNSINSPYLVFADSGNMRVVTNPLFLQDDSLLGTPLTFASVVDNDVDVPFTYWGDFVNDIGGGYGGAEIGGVLGGAVGGPIGAPIGAVIGGCLFAAAASGLFLTGKGGSSKVPQSSIRPLPGDLYTEVFSAPNTSAGILHNALLNSVGSNLQTVLSQNDFTVNSYLGRFSVLSQKVLPVYIKPTIPYQKISGLLFNAKHSFSNYCQLIVSKEKTRAFNSLSSEHGRNQLYSFMCNYIITAHSIKTDEAFWSYNTEVLKMLSNSDFIPTLLKVKLQTITSIGYNSFCYWYVKSKEQL